MIARLNKRGRSYEQVANDPTLYDYYKELNQRYDAWYEAFDVSENANRWGSIRFC